MSKVRNPEAAIHRLSEFGPCFGGDIFFANNANSNKNSHARLGWSYPAPAAAQNLETILAGTYRFSPDEVEVFYLDPTQ